MSHSYDQDDIPAPRPWQVGSKFYSVTRLSPLALTELDNLIRSRVPDPRLGVKELIKGLEPEMAKFIWVEETKNLPAWPPRIGDTDDLRWVDPVFSVEGRAIWIYHSLRKSNKGFTRDQAIELAEQTSPEEFDTLFALQVEMLSDPKSRADRTPEADGKVTQKPEVGSV